MYKVIITYDVQQGQEQASQMFLSNSLAPGLAQLGLRLQDVWFTIWGQSPQILSAGVVESLEDAQRIVNSDEWDELFSEMEQLTQNLSVRVVRSNDESAN